ncbi:single-stranded DNA-binding protein [Actomonas aquatica]|uniref:Single-stranded DNA-binding protein n=1 Tax=Actomonas aquatica TaxID=2866162 RepID=A0ABZ1C7D1_9BACT|nr:single-stranded DNA-binding protein [Opitutus sp. WL0086]WRQ87626.1 single-stranded DNA-binding protein [Opitutus sp. WL0086]
MANLNRVLLIGNLTRDPELRVTPKGNSICQFGLAVNRSFKDGSGQTREETTFIDVEAWGRQGETISKYCTKGRALFVEGRLRFDQWEDKNTGQKRSRLSVVLENFQFIGGRGDGDNEGGGSSGGGGNYSPSPERNSPPPRAPRPAPADDNLDEDVPF